MKDTPHLLILLSPTSFHSSPPPPMIGAQPGPVKDLHRSSGPSWHFNWRGVNQPPLSGRRVIISSCLTGFPPPISLFLSVCLGSHTLCVSFPSFSLFLSIKLWFHLKARVLKCKNPPHPLPDTCGGANTNASIHENANVAWSLPLSLELSVEMVKSNACRWWLTHGSVAFARPSSQPSLP